MLFKDEDGKVYYYAGCSDQAPIRGVELDSETFLPVGELVPLIAGEEG
jgi:hypothetical protein